MKPLVHVGSNPTFFHDDKGCCAFGAHHAPAFDKKKRETAASLLDETSARAEFSQ
jgi:hypothetical protein